ncbi:AurF N-oxygenase family protein [Rhodococcus sp. SGAir0479]|uniref:AurF N-oxygenase family protein n=1 Tax=Rhodococcus sp. SGAir0479 TaxID=2567884 RepID=UPI0010CD1846|nr:diiron oxygenase [Rhodococcus sp. SGAir0479]QCQ91123.1 diiron oxygenase [Rhodococcus sp. SGAir0479]
MTTDPYTDEAATHESMLRLPSLPSFDPGDPVESAVIRSLAGTWPRRATVKRREPDLDDLFDAARADYPAGLIPFRDDDRFTRLDEPVRARVHAWAWIAYNKNVMDVEQYVVNPGFRLLSQDAFGTGLGDTLTVSTLQAMVDEQYHTLMHLNASALTRRRRGWHMPEARLPYGPTVRHHHAAVAAADTPRESALLSLAYTTVAETSISSYLGLMTDDLELQPVNRATVVLHRRDEYCHSSIAGELLKIVYERLSRDDRHVLLSGLAAGLRAFEANDYATWNAIMAAENVRDGAALVSDAAHDAERRKLVQDCSAIHRLCADLDVVGEVPYEW